MKKKNSTDHNLTDSEIDQQIEKIVKLDRKGNACQLRACIYIAELVQSLKESKRKKVVKLYKKLGLSVSEGQKRAKVGRAFENMIKNGQMAAFSISHLKVMLKIKRDIVENIVKNKILLNCEQLGVVSKNQFDFENITDRTLFLNGIKKIKSKEQDIHEKNSKEKIDFNSSGVKDSLSSEEKEEAENTIFSSDIKNNVNEDFFLSSLNEVCSELQQLTILYKKCKFTLKGSGKVKKTIKVIKKHIKTIGGNPS